MVENCYWLLFAILKISFLKKKNHLMNFKRIIGHVFGSHLLFTVSTNIVLAFLALASGSLAARILGVAGRGELAAIQIWPTFLAGFSILGLSEAIVYFTAKESQLAGRYLVSAISLTLLVSVPIMGLGYFLIPIFLASQAPQVVATSRIYLLMIPLFSIVGLPLQTLRGRNDLLVWNLIRLALPFGWVCILLFIGLSGRNSPEQAALGYLWMMGLLFLPVAYIISRRIPGPYRFERDLWSPMLRFGLPSVAASLPVMLNLRLDQFLMAAFLSPQVLGLYVVAVAWAAAVSPLLNAICIIIFPQVASQTSFSERTRVLLRGIHLAVLVGAGVAVLLMTITPFALPLIFGDDFAQAIPASLILIFAGVISNINSILGDGMRGFGKPSIVLVSECVGLVATILALALLLKPLGILGASISSLLGYSGTLLALLLQISRIIELRFRAILLPDRSDITWISTRFRGLLESV
jgi:O-antigen/teichoic acid export membrane protein